MPSPQDYMQLALIEAQKAAQIDEIPVGCVIVNPATDEIIAAAHNHNQHSFDTTAHAEILAIRSACDVLQQPRLWDMDIYVTLEPCAMCAAAISFARIRRLYFGAFDEKGGNVVNGTQFFNQKICHHKPEVYGGILQELCSQILKRFFQAKR